ncbi:hypothetical protein J3B02_002282 [Coemansia erecta]|nr:hypothetical protein J3B02_002282 [Coemansia erecta]KAJ2880503.1 hypothetical protein FB639_002816 [Coemansia asiatica]
MSFFQELPAIIQAKILRYCIDAPGNRRQKPVYLSICHEWRELAKPSFYRFAYIIEKKKAHSSTDHIQDADAKLNAEMWSGNIDLILSVHALRSVKKLYVEIKTVDGLHDFVQNVSPIFALDNNELAGVKSMEFRVPVTLEQQFRTTDNFEREYRVFREEAVKTLSANLSKGIPNILKLDLVSGQDDCFASALGSWLAKIYSNRLKVLSGVAPITFGPLQSLPHIIILDITLDSSATLILPRTNPLMLDMLRLHYVTRRFSWSYFDFNDNSGSICFPNLSSLFLSFVDDVLDADPEYKDTNGSLTISFPNLKSLCVLDYPQNYSLFSNCVLPANMEFILLTDALDIFKSMELNTKTFIEDISVTIANDPIDDQAYQVLNHLFGSSIESKQCRLSVRQQFEPDIDIIFWPNLEKLDLQAVYFAELIALLPKMHSLQNLTVTEVLFDTLLPNGIHFDPMQFINAESALIDCQVSNI